MPTDYSGDFTATGVDGWTTSGGTLSRQTSNFRSSPAMLQLANSGVANRIMSRTLTGLTVGVEYTYTAWLARTNITTSNLSLGVQGIGQGAAISPAANTYGQATYTFTATATSHVLQIFANFQGLHNVRVDDILVTSPDVVIEQDIAVGSTLLDGIDDIRIGTEVVNKVYLGTTLIYG